jgi:hypothetical protein
MPWVVRMLGQRVPVTNWDSTAATQMRAAAAGSGGYRAAEPVLAAFGRQAVAAEGERLPWLAVAGP